MASEEDAAAGLASGGRRPFWRSASWSASRTSTQDLARACSTEDKNSAGGPPRCFPPLPLTPRSQGQKPRSCLPPLAIARRGLDEWPKPGSDDLEQWPQQPSPSAKTEALKPVNNGLKLYLPSPRPQVRREQIAFFDKECSKVAHHIYLGGDYVAKNREILRQHGITHVLNCVGFVCPEYFKSDLVYKTLWLQDSPTEDITSILYDVFDYFEDVRQQGGKVFVHCCQGVSRSTSLVIAYLMWREGQSFDDAFQFVKAARGIANPNMGFACQLLQCQKRVHAIPLSPTSLLRMYRMAPHSSYDPLHLVPKMLNDPSPAALDSRGAFIVCVLSSIYVWIGNNCESVMEKDAKAAAFQVVRYERIQGPIVTIKEGKEPSKFWEAFSSSLPSGNSGTRINKKQIESATKTIDCARRVESYNVDFELFYKALAGGVIPPFASSGHDQVTHLPARESNWSILRCKFLSGTTSRVYSDSASGSVRDRDPCTDKKQLLAVEASTPPPYLSPSPLSFDTSNSKCGLESPSFSPSMCYSPLTSSPASLNLAYPLPPSSSPSSQFSSTVEPLKQCSEAVSHSSKGLASSIAERRGRFFSSKLSALRKDASLSSRKILNAASRQLESFEEGCRNDIPGNGTLDSAISLVQKSHINGLGKSLSSTSEDNVNLQKDIPSNNDLVFHSSTGLAGILMSTRLLVYRWPNLEKLETFAMEDLDSKELFLFLTSKVGQTGEEDKILLLWVGGQFEQNNRQTEVKDGQDEMIVSIDWHQFGRNFLGTVGLPKNLPIQVVKEQEAGKLFQLLNST